MHGSLRDHTWLSRHHFQHNSNPTGTQLQIRAEKCELCCCDLRLIIDMITSSNGNIFRVTGHMYGEFTGHRWIPRTKASDAELWCVFIISAWINALVNSREAGDLRRNRAQYDVIVLEAIILICVFADWTKILSKWQRWISDNSEKIHMKCKRD